MNHLTPRKVRTIVLGFFIVGIVIELICGLTGAPISPVVGIVIMLLGVVFHFAFYRCPHCGKFLNRDSSKGYCPHCGEKLEG